MSRRIARILALASLVGAAACADDGPGSWTATVNGPLPVGAALVEVRGSGVTGFAGTGDARVFPDPSPAAAGVWRVVVVSPSGAATFRVAVEDVSGAAPAVTLVSAADASNRPLQGLAGYSVRVAR